MSVAGRLCSGETMRRVEARLEGGELVACVDGEAVRAEVASCGEGDVVLRREGRRVLATVARVEGGWLVAIGGAVHRVVRAEAAGSARGAPAASETVAASPMPGVLRRVDVVPGGAVARGAPVFAVEAMKMEYVVRAPRDAVVAEVLRAAGDRVAAGDVVVRYRPGDAAPVETPS